MTSEFLEKHVALAKQTFEANSDDDEVASVAESSLHSSDVDDDDDASSDPSEEFADLIEETPMSCFLDAQYMAIMTLGKSWDGRRLVNVDDAHPPLDVLSLFDDDMQLAITQFHREHAERIAAQRNRSPRFAALLDVFQRVRHFEALESTSERYVQYAVTYALPLCDGVLPQAIVELDANLDHKYLMAVWLVADVDTSSRVYFYNSLPAGFAIGSVSLLETIGIVGRNRSALYHQFEGDYERAWPIIAAAPVTRGESTR